METGLVSGSGFRLVEDRYLAVEPVQALSLTDFYRGGYRQPGRELCFKVDPEFNRLPAAVQLPINLPAGQIRIRELTGSAMTSAIISAVGLSHCFDDFGQGAAHLAARLMMEFRRGDEGELLSYGVTTLIVCRQGVISHSRVAGGWRCCSVSARPANDPNNWLSGIHIISRR